MTIQLQSAVDEALHSTVPGGSAVRTAALDVIIRSAPTALSITVGDARYRYVTALILSLSRSGRTDDALAISDRHLDTLSADSSVSESSLIGLLAAVSEAYVTAGWPQRSAPLAERALSYAELVQDEVAMYRATALLALSRALNGEYAAAAAETVRCRELQSRNRWEVAEFSYPLILGEILIASAQLDHAALFRSVAELRTGRPGDALWAATADVAEGMALLAAGTADRALTLIAAVISGTTAPGIHAMVRGFGIGIYADILLSRGEPRRALSLLEGVASPPGHALCFDMQRAAAYLLIDDDLAALRTTDGCVSLGAAHCLRTTPPVLLRRAIAYERLGQQAHADERFAEAFHHLARSRSSTPLLTLPSVPLDHLVQRFENTYPGTPGVDELRERISRIPATDTRRAALPRLTPREERLAGLLRSDAPLAELGRELHVSPNTVKTQIRSLYRKLGVTSRADAVATLHRAGFFY